MKRIILFLLPILVLSGCITYGDTYDCYGKGNDHCIQTEQRTDKVMRPEMTIYEINHPEMFNKGEKK